MTQPPADRRQANLTSIFTILAILVVIGYSWRGCWYATPLSDAEISRRLAGNASPSELQKALYQIKERADEGDDDLSQFHDALAALESHEVAQIRSTLAWTLGSFTDHEPLVATLRHLLADPEPMVRYNAATSIAAEDFAAARPHLHAMLAETLVAAPIAGKLDVPRNRKHVEFGLVLGRIEAPDGGRRDVVAPIAGRLRESFKRHGDTVDEGDKLFRIEPTMGQIENALVVLRLLGTKADVAAVQGVIEGGIQLDEGTRRLAEATLTAIRDR